MRSAPRWLAALRSCFAHVQVWQGAIAGSAPIWTYVGERPPMDPLCGLHRALSSCACTVRCAASIKRTPLYACKLKVRQQTGANAGPAGSAASHSPLSTRCKRRTVATGSMLHAMLLAFASCMQVLQQDRDIRHHSGSWCARRLHRHLARRLPGADRIHCRWQQRWSTAPARRDTGSTQQHGMQAPSVAPGPSCGAARSA